MRNKPKYRIFKFTDKRGDAISYVAGTNIRVVTVTKHSVAGYGGLLGERVYVGEDGNRYDFDGTLINSVEYYYGKVPQEIQREKEERFGPDLFVAVFNREATLSEPAIFYMAFGHTATESVESLLYAYVEEHCMRNPDADPGMLHENREFIEVGRAIIGKGYIHGGADQQWMETPMAGNYECFDDVFQAYEKSSVLKP